LVEHLPRKQKAKGSTPLTGFFDYFINYFFYTEIVFKFSTFLAVFFIKAIIVIYLIC